MDYLITIRRNHWILMLLSITALFTSVVPRSTVETWLALDELQVVERMEHAPLSSQISLHNSGLLGRDSSNQVGVWIFPQPPMTEVIRQIAAGHNTLTRLLRATFPDRQDISFRTATLAEIRSALGFAFYMPVPSPRDLPKLKECFDVTARPIELRVVVRYDGERLDVAIPGEPAYDGRRFAEATVKDRECMRFPFTLIDFRTLMESWRAESDILLALKDQGYQPTEPTSSLALSNLPIWRIVEDRTVAEAKADLSRRLEFADRSQELFGLSTFRALLVVSLPLLILVVQFLLWLHIIAARDVVPASESRQVAWIGIYKGTSSRLASNASLIFPAICIAVLWWAADVDVWKTCLAVMASVALGIAAALSSGRLRKRSYPGSQSPADSAE